MLNEENKKAGSVSDNGHGCFLYCAGEYFESYFRPSFGDLVVAVDGGCNAVKKLGLQADVSLGDFDSLGFVPTDGEILQLPAEKDETDTQFACRHFFDLGYKRFYFIGATGGRPDHTMANIQSLVGLAEKGAVGFAFSDGYVFTAVKNAKVVFTVGYSGYVSSFSAGEKAGGVYMTGLKYPLCNAVLTNTDPLGVSNEFTGCGAEISVGDGTLIIMFERRSCLPLPQIERKCIKNGDQS